MISPMLKQEGLFYLWTTTDKNTRVTLHVNDPLKLNTIVCWFATESVWREARLINAVLWANN